MGTKNRAPMKSMSDALPKSGSGSVAHQIIAAFHARLAEAPGFENIATALSDIIYEEPSEAALRRAIFNDEPL